MKKPDCCNVDESRRSFLLRSIGGLGALSLLDLMGGRALGAGTETMNVGVLGSGPLQARAKRVICLHMLGAISHVDTFDYKPMLVKMHGQDLPESVRNTQRLSTMSGGQSAFPIVGPLRPFRQYGESGAWVSDFLPYTGAIADDLCFVKSVHTEHVNHDPASKFLHTGFQLAGRPSAGAWVSYALGADNRDLPNFIVMNSGISVGVPQDSAIWSSGFLPSHHQGVEFRAAADPVLYVNNPQGIDRPDRRAMLDTLGELALLQHEQSHDPEILSRMSQYEMAYRMQASVPEVADIRDEPESVLAMYGPDVKKPGTFARNCLIARRLAERGVKYQVLFGMGWDHHLAIKQALPVRCQEIDQPSAALVMDLKQRGLLDDTLVMFGSEFGRTPFAQGQIDNPLVGRDHHGGCFTWWFAGGGVKAGHSHGETDDFSYNVVKDGVHIHDLNATLMALLGIDHERLTYRFQGRDYRLTDVHGKVVKEIIA
ncbi:MAG: DUF1501 domain-containing protein [Gammaproteobacteria bacterium]